MAGKSVPKRRGLARRVLLSAVTVVICLVAGEIVARVFKLAPEIYVVSKGRFRLASNPRIGYELVPHFEATTGGAMLDFAGKANSLGFRDREHALAKKPGVYRILVLGDSITQGLSIERAEDIYTSVLERQLNTDGVRVEVLNFGVSGYNTQQEVETLREKGLRFAPDMVVLAACVNDSYLDCGGILRYLQAEKDQHRVAIGTPPVLTRSALGRLLWVTLESAGGGSTSLQEEFTELADNTMGENLAELARLATAHDFEVVVLWFPRLVDAYNSRDRELLAEVQRRSVAGGFFLLDLTPGLVACAEAEPIAVDAIHPNRRGHRCVGETVAFYLRTEILPAIKRSGRVSSG